MNLAQALPRRLAQRAFRLQADDVLPQALEHRRIYILPSRRGWAFLLCLLIMLIASINYALSLGYALCFLLTGLFWASLLHTYRNLAGLSVEGIDSEPAFSGQDLVFRIRLRNPSSLARHGLRVTAHRSDAVLDRLGPRASAPLAIGLPGATRGRLALGRLTLSSDYPLGLWRCWCYVHAAAEELVYPAPEVDAPPLPGAPQTTGEHRTRSGAQGDVAGLRDYQTGDAITSIAWKSAARGQGLHVRLFDAEPEGSRLHLTLTATGCSDREEQLSRLAAWILRAETLPADYSLELPGVHLPAAHGEPQRRNTLAALATFGLPDRA